MTTIYRSKEPVERPLEEESPTPKTAVIGEPSMQMFTTWRAKGPGDWRLVSLGVSRSVSLREARLSRRLPAESPAVAVQPERAQVLMVGQSWSTSAWR